MRVFAQQTKPIYYDKLLRISLKAIYKKKWPSLTKEEGGARLKIALEELQLAKLQPANTKI